MPFIGKIYAAILSIKISKDDGVDKINGFGFYASDSGLPTPDLFFFLRSVSHRTKG